MTQAIEPKETQETQKVKEDNFEIVVNLLDKRRDEISYVCFHCWDSFKLGVEIVNETFKRGNFFCVDCAEKELSPEHHTKIKEVLSNEKRILQLKKQNTNFPRII